MATGPVPPAGAAPAPPPPPPGPDAPAAAAPGSDALSALSGSSHRGRKWLLRVVVAGLVLGALLVAGRRFYGELHRLRDAPPLLVAAISLLWLASRYPAADVMRVALRALGHRIGRYEAFMLQMVQSYGNVLVPRAGIGMPALYMKLRHDTPFADFGAVQILPMTLMQVFTIGVVGLISQAGLLATGGAEPDRLMTAVFAIVAAACVVPLVIRFPADRFMHGKLALFVARLIVAWHQLGGSRPLLARVVLTHTAMLFVRALRVMLCFHAVGADVSYAGALAASLLADLAFVFAVTPSGLGFREFAVVYAARVVGTTGDVALAAAILDRLVGTAVTVVVGQIGAWQFIQPVLRSRPSESTVASTEASTAER